jgi:hypothetical protein
MLIGAPKLEDFPPLNQEEFRMIAQQIVHHLNQGVPKTAPVQGLPMEAMCRILRTIMVLAHQSEQALVLFSEVFNGLGEEHLALRHKLAPYALQGEDLTDFLSSNPLPELPDVISEMVQKSE